MIAAARRVIGVSRLLRNGTDHVIAKGRWPGSCGFYLMPSIAYLETATVAYNDD